MRFLWKCYPNPERVVGQGLLPTTAYDEYLHIMAAHGYTWSCRAHDEMTCVPLLRQIADSAGTLADGTELLSFRDASGTVMGMISAAGIAQGMLGVRSTKDIASAQAVVATTRALPNQGQTPVPLVAVVSDERDSGPGTLRGSICICRSELTA